MAPEINHVSVFKSKHTNNDLEKIKIYFTLDRKIDIPDNVKSDDGKMWKVGTNSNSYTEGVPGVDYTM